MITRNVDILSDETRSVLEDMPEYLIIYSYVKRTDSFTLTLITNELFSHLGGNRKKLRDFYEDHQDDFIYGSDYDYLVQTMKKAMSNPTSTYKIVLRLMTSNKGEYLWMHANVRMKKNDSDFIYISCTDAPNDKENRLKNISLSEHADLLFDKIVNTTQDCIFWKDTQRRFVGVNQAFLDFYGFTSADVLIGKTDEEMEWHPNPQPFMEDELRVLQGESTRNVLGQCIVKGQIRDIMASKTPIYDGGVIIGFVGSFMDVTEQNKRMAKIERLNRLNDQLLENEKKANRRMSEFLSRMSNEIKTPLNAVSALSFLGMNQNDPEVLKSDMRKIYTSSHYISKLMSDLLDIDKIDGGNLNLAPASTSLDAIVDGVESITYALAKEKDIEVEINREYKGNPQVICDLGRAQQMVINLTSNAVKFSERGDHISLTVKSEKKRDNYKITFIVKDEGCGISTAFMPSLFRAFAQEKRNPSKYGTGTGLGLSVAKRLACLMRGDIIAESEEGIGSTFTATIELEKAELKL
ncbi:MAG: PAS domain-containing sensor histidine kinase [Butyrivibrio sp.]|nr:PAS domain-containing sensor histidine kinase [Butyrivibrio sp.]